MTVPPVKRAQVCSTPAEIWVTPERPLTLTGVEESVVVPSPSWPALLYPQHVMVPPVRRAQVWWAPAAKAVACRIPDSEAAVDAVLMPPGPVTLSVKV